MQIPYGATKRSLYFMLTDSATGARKTGVASGAVTGSYARNKGNRVAITVSALTNPNSAWAAGGWKEVDSSNQPGLYRFDIPDAAFAYGSDVDSLQVATVEVTVSATGAHAETKEVYLIPPGTTQGSIGASTNDQPTFVEYTFVDGTVRKDWK